jgi:hypothetical protein
MENPRLFVRCACTVRAVRSFEDRGTLTVLWRVHVERPAVAGERDQLIGPGVTDVELAEGIDDGQRARADARLLPASHAPPGAGAERVKASRGTTASTVASSDARCERNGAVRNGMSQAITSICSVGASTSAVYSPPNAPAPAMQSATTGTPLACPSDGPRPTIRICGVIARSTAGCLTRIGAGLTRRTLASRPPRRRAWPPASIAAEIRLYSLAHVCWRLPPGRAPENPPAPLGTAPATPPTDVSSGVKGIRNIG